MGRGGAQADGAGWRKEAAGGHRKRRRGGGIARLLQRDRTGTEMMREVVVGVEVLGSWLLIWQRESDGAYLEGLEQLGQLV